MADVVVLEPNEADRGILCRCLEGAGYRVLQALDIRQVMSILAVHEAPLVLVVDPGLTPFRRNSMVRRLLRERPTEGAYVLNAPSRLQFKTVSAVFDRSIGAVLLPRPFDSEALLLGVEAAAARVSPAVSASTWMDN